jgi:hypothetical protein
VTRGIVPTRKRIENTRHSFSHATHFRPMPARHSLCPVALGEHCPDRRHVGRAQPLRVPARSERRGSSPRRRSMRGSRTAARPLLDDHIRRTRLLIHDMQLSIAQLCWASKRD